MTVSIKVLIPPKQAENAQTTQYTAVNCKAIIDKFTATNTTAGNVTISGQLKGNIKALDRVDITKDADFNGEIKAKRISVEDGAYLKAVIEVERESQKKVEPVGKVNDSFASAPGKEPIPLVSEGDKGK